MFGDGSPIVDAFFAPASAVVALVALAWHLAFARGVRGFAGQWKETMASS